MLYMIFKSKFGVKNQAKEFSIFHYFNMCFFPRRMLGFGKNPYCCRKWMQTISEAENLKPFSDTQSLTLLTHSYRALSNLFKDLPHTHRVLLTLMLNRAGDRMLPCGIHISSIVQLRQNGPQSNPERTFGHKALNKPGDMAPETKIPEVRQNAVLPRCLVGLLKVKENG